MFTPVPVRVPVPFRSRSGPVPVVRVAFTPANIAGPVPVAGCDAFTLVPERDRNAYGYTPSGVARGGTGAMTPQTFGECFFSPINLPRYVLLVCK